jgi:DNA-binding transcriptional MerR regulator
MHGHRGPHRRPPFGRRWYSRDNVLERLERYQRDLEQELADVSDLIQKLRVGETPQETTGTV